MVLPCSNSYDDCDFDFKRSFQTYRGYYNSTDEILTEKTDIDTGFGAGIDLKPPGDPKWTDIDGGIFFNDLRILN